MARNRKGIPEKLLMLAIIAAVLVFAVVAIPWMQADSAARSAAANAHRAAELAEREAAQTAGEAALTAAFRDAFAAGDRAALVAFCQERIEWAAHTPQAPTALAFHPQRIDAFYRHSLRRDRLDRYGCTPAGVVHERVAWPRALPVDLEPDGAVEASAADSPPGSWRLLADQAVAAESDQAVLRIEQFADPEHPVPLLRWHAADGRVLRREPAEAAEFAALSALAADAPLAQAPRSPLRQPQALLEMLADGLPVSAAVHRVFVDHDAVVVDLSLQGQLQRRQFDGFGDPHASGTPDPSAALCTRSPSPAALVAGFRDACAAVDGCRPDAPLDAAAFFCERGSDSAGWRIVRGAE